MKTNSAVNSPECSPAPDVNYFLTPDGLLKCLAIALNFLCFLCISVGGYYMGIGFSTFVSVIGFTISLLFILLYIFHLADNFEKVPWAATEMVFCFVWTLFSFISGSILGVAATQQEGTFGWAVAAFFSFSAMCVYGLDCYMKGCEWKREEPDMSEGV